MSKTNQGIPRQGTFGNFSFGQDVANREITADQYPHGMNRRQRRAFEKLKKRGLSTVVDPIGFEKLTRPGLAPASSPLEANDDEA